MTNYDIRKVNENFREVHSRYYVDTKGVFYTSLSQNTNRIMIDGVNHNIRGIKTSLLSSLNRTNKQMAKLPIDGNSKYFLLYDGTVLQRLATRVHKNGRITVCLIRVFGGNDSGNHYEVHRILAGTFIGSVDGKEVHHIDKNPMNNNLENLEILTFEEHRGKESIKHM